ncbi:MAG TPA: sugar transferase [Pyrinomonadaceae bacterium]
MQARREFSKPFRDLEAVPASTTADSPRSACQLLGWSYRAGDALAALVSIAAAFLITNLNTLPADFAGFLRLRVSVKNLLVMVIFAGLWLAIIYGLGLYRKRSRRYAALRLIAATACGSLCALLFVFSSNTGAFRFDAVIWCWIIALPLTLSVRLFLRNMTEPIATTKHPRQVLIVGTGARAARCARELRAPGNENYQVLGFLDIPGTRAMSFELKQKLLGDLSQLESTIIQNQVDEVLITLPIRSCYEEVQQAIEICERTGVECKYLSDIFRPSSSQMVAEEISGFSVTSLKPTRHDSRRVVKRAIDIAGALVGLIVLLPVFLIISLAIKLSSGGPVIFSQGRHGRNRRPFRMYKFRTMVNQAEQLQSSLESCNEATGPVFKIKNDPRVTRVGALLRRTSLDELPQLFNVLKGEMSLVGPRPLPVRDVSKIDEGRLLRRFCVVPGLTGLWQVNGRSTVNFEEWMKQDFHYIDNWSLRLDFQILAKTIPVVMKGVGAV